ncbi:LacI family DNA-binding transcriptional regulator [Streptomyces sp. NPDC048277]|uniref:LacI family DNA-binding transcriptional regulator n=1 Tax=Streptomyces sp. NPDC048277 TaxID=3155027 RepID=UPI003404E3E3
MAQEASLSLGTVSNVLNRPELVAKATRTRVLTAIDSLGYVRSEEAKQLRGRASRVLTVMVLGLANPFCAALASGVEQAAHETGLGVMACTGARDPATAASRLALTSHQIRGAVLPSCEDIGRTVSAFRDNANPFVMADQNAPQPSACSIKIDDVTGSRNTVRHLIRLGHRSISYVSGPDRLQQVRGRHRGVLSAIRQASLPATSLLELSCHDLTVSAGKEAGDRFLGLRERPTAVFCANDLLALGVMQALYEADLRVPEGVAIAGYDDIEFAASAVVPLASVSRPAAAMGVRAGRLLIEEATPDAPHEHTHGSALAEQPRRSPAPSPLL